MEMRCAYKQCGKIFDARGRGKYCCEACREAARNERRRVPAKEPTKPRRRVPSVNEVLAYAERVSKERNEYVSYGQAAAMMERENGRA